MSKCDKVTVIVQRTTPSMKVYIAGKITGDENYRLKFMKARQRLERDGYIVISPAVLPDRLTEADYMRICFSMIDCAVAVAIHDLVDIMVAAINEAWQPMKDAWEEIQKLMEQYEDVDEPEEEDRHDGAVEALVTWLLPVPTLYELYGQGVDHGGPGPSRLTLTRVTDDGLRRAETGRNRKGEHAMIIFANVLLGIAAGTLFLGVIGEKDKEKHRDVTLCFVATMATIVLLNVLA